MPVDAPNPYTNDIQFRRRSLSMQEVSQLLRQAHSRHIFVAFNSCFSGTLFASTRATPVANAISYFAQYPVRQLLTSGSASQPVLDDGYFQRLFTDAILGREPTADANRDGFLTGSELMVFMRHKVIEHGLSLQKPIKQTPLWGEFNLDGANHGDFLFELPNKAPYALAATATSAVQTRGPAPTDAPPVSFNRRIWLAPLVAPSKIPQRIMGSHEAQVGGRRVPGL